MPPILSGQPFAAPAGVPQIAAALQVTQAAVKRHLLRLYREFGIRPA